MGLLSGSSGGIASSSFCVPFGRVWVGDIHDAIGIIDLAVLVMVAKSGDSLLHENARKALIERLLPHTDIVTPNMGEAAALAGMPVEDEASMCEAAKRISALGPRYTLVKGGHLGGNEARDFLFDGESFEVFAAPRIETSNFMGPAAPSHPPSRCISPKASMRPARSERQRTTSPARSATACRSAKATARSTTPGRNGDNVWPPAS